MASKVSIGEEALKNILLLLAIIIAIFDWIAVAKGKHIVECVAKPATMLVLLTWVVLNGGLEPPTLWFTLGLLLSLAGDVLLLLPKNLFIYGLVSFLLGHTSYLIGLNIPFMSLNIASLVLLVVVLATGLLIYRRITAGLQAGDLRKLKFPVAVYSLIIGLMLFSALNTLIRPDWSLLAAFSVSAGALLFFISDTLLAWDKFVAPVQNGRVIVMITYHLGQIGIALGAILHLAG